METLESSRVCRLCGNHSGISINIFDRSESHVRKINAVLPIMVHEMDLLPKHMCHRCSYKLEEFHKFYVDCLKTDADLKSQLSWMRKEESREKIGVPMVHIENVKIKVEPPDYDVYELEPIVENVNYINSMSTMAFPVARLRTCGIHEGIAYAAYARCRCCCDKTDQSRQTVSSMDYDSTVSRNDRVNDVDVLGGVGNLQVVKKDPLEQDAYESRDRSCLSTKGTSSTVDVGDFLSRSTIVRNLRPRRGSVDYVGAKKKLLRTAKSGLENRSKRDAATRSKFEMPKIKVERMDDFEGRILRPRKETIDYIGPKRKYSRSLGKDQQKRADGYRAKRHKSRKIVDESKLIPAKVAKYFAKDEMRLSIKQELLSDLEDTVLDESRVAKSRVKSNVRGLSKDVGPLSDTVLVDVKSETPDYGTSDGAQSRSNFRVTSKSKPLTGVTKSRLRSGKVGGNRLNAITYPPAYLRSQDIHLRNGKVRKFGGADTPMMNLRKNLRDIGERGRPTGQNLMRAIRGTVNAKKVPAAINLIDNIKHYCEKCNISFANKEVYKLHECYD